MTQNASDVEIANQGFAAFRQDLNDVLEDITTLHSGTAAPSTTYANQWWYETDTDKLYIRNEDNDAWIEILTLDQANDHLATLGASITLDGTGNVSIDSGDFTVDTDTLYVDSTNNRTFVGKTSSNFATTGVELHDDGTAIFTKSSSSPLTINRTTNDGGIIAFYKDGSSVGSIGTQGGRLSIGDGDTGLRFADDFDNIQPFNLSTNALRDNAIDLGSAAGRFTDLYLGGGVYLGGTGSANKLDDYEEGTFTPTVTSGTISSAAGTYRKIGSLCTVTGVIGNFSDRTSSAPIGLTGLPFNIGKTDAASPSGNMSVGFDERPDTAYALNSTEIRFYNSQSVGSSYVFVRYNDLNLSGSSVYFSFTYITS